MPMFQKCFIECKRILSFFFFSILVVFQLLNLNALGVTINVLPLQTRQNGAFEETYWERLYVFVCLTCHCE